MRSRVLVSAGIVLTAFGLMGMARPWDPCAVGVTAVAETEPVPSDGDAADDPAIYVDPVDPAKSLVLGTDKRSGLGVYDLQGRQRSFHALGKVNNVDLRQGFVAGGRTIVLVATACMKAHEVVLLELDPAQAELRELPGSRFRTGVEPQGLALYHRPGDGALFVFVAGDDDHSEDDVFEQWALEPAKDGAIHARLARRASIGGTAEGMVADDERGLLYVAEEAVGVWRYGASPDATGRSLLAHAGFAEPLRADVEGLCILRAHGRRLLVVSSQGSDDFVVFDVDREPAALLGRFEVQSGLRTDGVTHTDGIDVTGAPLPGFPAGLFICQDDREPGGNQNFKLVSWRDVATALGLAQSTAFREPELR